MIHFNICIHPWNYHIATWWTYSVPINISTCKCVIFPFFPSMHSQPQKTNNLTSVLSLKVSGNPALNKSIGTIFPTTFAQFMSICHILVIFTIFQTFIIIMVLIFVMVIWIFDVTITKRSQLTKVQRIAFCTNKVSFFSGCFLFFFFNFWILFNLFFYTTGSINHQFYTHQCIQVNPNCPIQHTTTTPPFSLLGVHTFVLYICISISVLQTGSSVPFF